MRLEGKIFSDGHIEIGPPDDSEAIFAAIVTVLIIIFCAWFGLYTIPDHGGSFTQYVFVNYIFYVCIAIITVLNTLLFFADASVKDIGIIEAIIGFFVYMVMGCKAYSAYGEWDAMSGLLEKVCSFFGLIWMSLFFCIVSVLVCVGVAAMICSLADLSAKKNSTGKKSARKTSSQTVQDYIQSHTNEFGKFYPSYKDVWKCSFCKEWTSMSQQYCDKCTQKRLYSDTVKCSDDEKK